MKTETDTSEKITTWYELLLRADPDWTPPNAAAVTELNYITTGFSATAAEFDDSLFQLLRYGTKQKAGMPLYTSGEHDGKPRPLEMFDILQVCCTKKVKDGSLFATKSFIIVPPESVRDFLRTGFDMKQSAEYSDIRLVQVKNLAASGRLPGWSLPRSR